MRTMILKLCLPALLVVLVQFSTPAMVSAQPMPGMGGGSMSASDPYHVRGRVDSFDGHYRVVVHGMRVRLHQGTVIQPRGATITPGQFVIVRGHWVEHHFEADEVRIRS
jgi:hypothetical protein